VAATTSSPTKTTAARLIHHPWGKEQVSKDKIRSAYFLYTHINMDEKQLTVWMKHPRNKAHGWWLVWIFFIKLESQLERT